MPAINLAAKLATFSEHFTPKIVAAFNGHDVMVAKLEGPVRLARAPRHRRFLPRPQGPPDDPAP